MPAETNTNRGGLAPWVIGGPARNGKTTLVNALNGIDAAVVGLPVEGLLGIYDRREGNATDLVREYLERPRWLDGARTQAARPVDFFDTPISDIVAAAAAGGGRPLAAIGRALDVFAADRGRPFWAVADLHAEMLFHRLTRTLPNLRLGVVLRDPRESLAATLYWQNYPERHPDARRRLRHGLALWCLSAEIALRLARLAPERVMILRFNRLVEGDRAELNQTANAFATDPEALHAALPRSPHFSLADGNTFITPDGGVAPLLDADEIALIEQTAGRWMRELGLTANLVSTQTPVIDARLRLIVPTIITLGRFAPEVAKALADEMFSPGRSIRRFASSVSRRLRPTGSLGA